MAWRRGAFSCVCIRVQSWFTPTTAILSLTHKPWVLLGSRRDVSITPGPFSKWLEINRFNDTLWKSLTVWLCLSRWHLTTFLKKSTLLQASLLNRSIWRFSNQQNTFKNRKCFMTHKTDFLAGLCCNQSFFCCFFCCLSLGFLLWSHRPSATQS